MLSGPEELRLNHSKRVFFSTKPLPYFNILARVLSYSVSLCCPCTPPPSDNAKIV